MNLKEFLQKLKLDPLRRTKVITFTTMVYNFFWAIGKILFGIFKMTYLYVLSGAYTLLLGFSKKIFITNHSKTTESINKETKSLVIGVLILIAGIAFAIYTGFFFIFPKEFQYGMIWSIAVAACSFVELGIAIFNLFRARRKKDILLESLRCCNFVSAMFAIVITQVAILSFTQTPNSAVYNASTGIVAGVLAVVVGTILIINACNKNKQKLENEDKMQKNIEKSDEIVEILSETDENL